MTSSEEAWGWLEYANDTLRSAQDCRRIGITALLCHLPTLPLSMQPGTFLPAGFGITSRSYRVLELLWKVLVDRSNMDRMAM